MKIKTNFMEILLREKLLGKNMYADDDTAIIVKELNFDPITNHAFIKDENDNGYRVGIMDRFLIDSDVPIKKVNVNKGKFNRSSKK